MLRSYFKDDHMPITVDTLSVAVANDLSAITATSSEACTTYANSPAMFGATFQLSCLDHATGGSIDSRLAANLCRL